MEFGVMVYKLVLVCSRNLLVRGYVYVIVKGNCLMLWL